MKCSPAKLSSLGLLIAMKKDQLEEKSRYIVQRRALKMVTY